MTENTVIHPAYVDEAGARGKLRDLTVERDHEFGLMCAVLFDPETHEMAIQDFTPPFEKFLKSAPAGAKLHITDAFKPGNEAWREVAEEVRENYVKLIQAYNPMVIYAARRLRLARAMHENGEKFRAELEKNRHSRIRVVGSNRPSDDRIEDDLIISLALRLDAFAELVAINGHDVKQVDLLFDEIDVAERYENCIQRTRKVSSKTKTVKGWDLIDNKRVEKKIGVKIDAPFRIDTKFIGGIHVVGKVHPLILAADIVTNYLAYKLRSLPADAPLNAPSSIEGWVLRDRVWGVMDRASEDLF